MQAVILAAGKGTRLLPVTRSRSKAMVPVLGRPLVERAVTPFFDNGIRDYIFVISREDAEIRDYFTNRCAFEISARFVVQEERLGMAHALGLAAPFISDRFAVSACDSLIDSSHVGDLLGAADDADAVLSLLDVERELVTRSGVVEFDGARILRIVEKPALETAPSNTVSLPHYVFSPHILGLLRSVKESPRGEYELQDAIQMLIDAGEVVAGIRAARRTQVSRPEDLLALTRVFFSEEAGRSRLASESSGHGVQLIDPCLVERAVVLGDGCSIGPEVFLESGCEIGSGAVVRRSIVLRGGRIADGETIEDQVVV
jgi:bifunctional UDP-N-acetylglucosamine pyrophosphorylase/glucosamine-1-phosphate N-acetyltransferase